MALRPCAWCDHNYTPHNPSQQHCSTRCAQTHRQHRVRQTPGYQPPKPRTWNPKGSTKERGLGSDHQRLRKQLLPLAYGTPCPMCGRIMLQGQRLVLDHHLPRALGGATTRDNVRIVHNECNHRAGTLLGAAIKRRKRR